MCVGVCDTKWILCDSDGDRQNSTFLPHMHELQCKWIQQLGWRFWANFCRFVIFRTIKTLSMNVIQSIKYVLLQNQNFLILLKVPVICFESHSDWDKCFTTKLTNRELYRPHSWFLVRRLIVHDTHLQVFTQTDNLTIKIHVKCGSVKTGLFSPNIFKIDTTWPLRVGKSMKSMGIITASFLVQLSCYFSKKNHPQ